MKGGKGNVGIVVWCGEAWGEVWGDVGECIE